MTTKSQVRERALRTGDIVHIGLGLMWLALAIYGLTANIEEAWAVAGWALAAGLHLGRLIERLP